MTLRVAILGGGVAGATLVHALIHTQPHVDVHIFESADTFHGSGLAISINKNARQAIELIGPSARQALSTADAKLQKGITWSLATGPDAGKQIDKLDETDDSGHLVTVVQRSEYLRTFLDKIPAERMHTGKKLVKIAQFEDLNESIVLDFADGTSHECDVLVGADGIHSFTRRYILGDVPAASPRPAEWYAIWMMKPYEQVRALLGADLVDINDPREHMWLGQDTFMIHNISGGELVQIVGIVRDPSLEEGKDWVQPLNIDEERNRWSSWPPHLSKALLTFLAEEKSPTGFCMWEHAAASTYVKGTVAIMGDAAHSMTPWQGAGGGMGLEDALMLASLLGRVSNRAQAVPALQIFDEVRRKRAQQCVESSKATGKLETGQTVPLTVAELKNNMAHRWRHIFEYDNEKARDEALQELDAKLSASQQAMSAKHGTVHNSFQNVGTSSMQE